MVPIWAVIPIAALTPVVRPVEGGLLALRVVGEGVGEENEGAVVASEEVDERGGF